MQVGPTFDSETSQKIGGGANFQDANLSNADLSGADLEDNITGNIKGVPASLPDGFKLIKGLILGPKIRVADSSDLSGSDLAGLNLQGAALPNVNFSGADLSDTRLKGAYLGYPSPTNKTKNLKPIIEYRIPFHNIGRQRWFLAG